MAYWHGVAWHGKYQSMKSIRYDPFGPPFLMIHAGRGWPAIEKKVSILECFCLEAPEHRKPSLAVCRIPALLSATAPPSPYIVYHAHMVQ